MQNQVKVLWVDDHIHDMEPFVAKLASIGFDVDVEENPEKAVDKAKIKKYNLIIADLKMEPIDGIDFLRKIDQYQEDAGRVILTSFLYLQKYKDRISALGFYAKTIEKPLPNFESEKFIGHFVVPLEIEAKEGRKSLANIHEQQVLSVDAINPFEITYDEFMALPILEKDFYSDVAIKMSRKAIMKAFDSGYCWVLLCGSKDIVRLERKNLNEIPSEKEILDYADGIGLAPYQVFKGILPEDYSNWSPCESDGNDMTNYPTMSLHFRDCEELTVHFDTGSPTTFFSYEEIVHMGAMNTSSTFIPAMRTDMENSLYRFARLDVSCNIVCQKNKETKSVKIIGQAVRNWIDSPFARICKDGASSPCEGRKNNGICKYRSALIGRNILTDNKLRITLDGEKKVTTLTREK